MKLSSHEEYGLRCLLQVARRGGAGSVAIPEISRAEGISTPYAAKLLRILRRGGFVKAARGKDGGYALAAPPAQIHVGNVLATLGGRFYEEGFCEKHSGTENSCVHSTDCSMRSLWRSVQGAVDRVLSGTTVLDLLNPHQDPSVAARLAAGFVGLTAAPADEPVHPISK